MTSRVWSRSKSFEIRRRLGLRWILAPSRRARLADEPEEEELRARHDVTISVRKLSGDSGLTEAGGIKLGADSLLRPEFRLQITQRK